MTKRQLGILAGAIAICSSGAVWAQGPQDTSSPEYLEAKQRLQEGKSLYGQHNLEGARLKFEQACAVLKTPACLRALGLSQFYTGRYIEALQNLQKSLDDKELDTASRKEVTDLVQQAFDKTGHIEIKAPGGGRVTIDDTTEAGNAPLASAVHVTVGSHAITVTFGEKTERMTVECPAGKVTQADFASKFPGASQGGVGNQGPAEGEHKVAFPPPSGALVLGIVGVVGVGLGIGFGAASSSQASDNAALALTTGGSCTARPLTGTCATLDSGRSSQQTLSIVSVVGYAAGGAALLGAVLWWALAPHKVHETAIVPSASPTGAALTLIHQF